MFRFYIISEKHGLIAVADTQERADEVALITAINTARTVYVHDRLIELEELWGRICATDWLCVDAAVNS
jgi:hypothetical protein